MEELEKLPTYFIWKTLRETLTLESPEENIKRLINIIQKPEYSHIFVNSIPNLTRQEHEEMNKKYKAFTVWIFGRFFYLLNQPNLIRVHPLIVDIQKRILHRIKVTQSHIYHELSKEYVNVLRLLNEYVSAKFLGTKKLKVFEPDTSIDIQSVLDLQPLHIEVNGPEQCARMQSILLKFMDFMLVEMFNCHCFCDMTYDILSNMLVVVNHGNLRLKMDVLKISSKLFQYSVDNFVVDDYKNEVFELLKCLIYQIHASNDDFSSIEQEFDGICCNILKTDQKNKHSIEISEYILSANCKSYVSDELKHICLKTLPKLTSNYTEKDRKKMLSLKDKIIEELKINENTTWSKIYKVEMDFLEESKDFEDLCNIKEVFWSIESLLEIALCVKFELDYVLVEETLFLTKFFQFVSRHVNQCRCDVDFKRFCRILTHATILGNLKCLKVVKNFCVAQIRDKGQVMDYGEFQTELLTIQGHFSNRNLSKLVKFECWIYFAVALSVTNQNYYWENENVFVQLLRSVMDDGDADCQIILAKNLNVLVSASKNFEEFYLHFILPLLTTEKSEVILKCIDQLPKLYMILCESYNKTVHFEGNSLIVQLTETGESIKDKYLIENCKRKLERTNCIEIVTILKTVYSIIFRAESEIRTGAILTLPAMAKYFQMFHKVQITKVFELVTSPEEKVRNTFCKIIGKTVENTLNREGANQSENAEILKNIFDFLLAETDKSLRLESHFHLQETIVFVLDELSILKYDTVEGNILKLTLYFIIMFTSKESDIAAMNLTNFAKTLQITPYRLYSKHRKEMCKVIVKVCVINFINGESSLNSSLETFASIIWNSRAKIYIIEETRHLIPFLVKSFCNNPQISSLIDEIASYNEVDVSELLADNYGYIYVQNFLNEDHSTFCRYMKSIEKRTKLMPESLRKNHFMVIISALLEHFHENREKIINGFTNLALEDGSTTVCNFLQPRLLGIIQYFEIKLVKPHCDKRCLLLSLSEIFRFMGPKFITPVRFKIMALLRTALTVTEDSLGPLNCQIWNVFLHSCDLEVLGPQLATIFVSIQPLINANRTEITKILCYLVVDHEQLFNDHLVDLFFVLDFDIDNRITNVIQRRVADVQKLPFKEHLMFFMRYFIYESVEVQIYALNYIRKLLKGHRENLSEMILGFNGIDPCVCDLLEYLTAGCREYDVKLKMACGECLAELGAIEPSHLPVSKSSQEDNAFSFLMSDPQFIHKSLNEFSKALQLKTNSQSMDKFSLAIQETFRVYEISCEESSKHYDIWNLLTESQKELMMPLITSKYFVAQNIDAITISPVYGSVYGSNLKSWLNNWCVKLISKLETSKKQLLTAYIPCMKQDMKILMFFLPYILLNSLIDGNAAVQNDAFDEFMAVILSIRPQQDDSAEYLLPIKMDNFAYSSETISFDTSFQIEFNKVIFVVFDFLERWIREWVWENGYSGQTDENFVKVKNFLSRFNKLQLAHSNFECGGYPRALMYLEDHMAEIGTNAEDQNENLELLSKIYYLLGEPDGVAGVTALRKSESTLEQRILHHEVSGQVPLATACYERLPTNSLQLQGLVRSQLDLDNVNTALFFAKGVSDDRQSESTCDWMLEAQAEAMWRLGRFDELDNYLKSHHLENSQKWGVRTGFCLMTLKNGDRDQFKVELQQLKMSQINYLSDSTLEEGTYQNGYFHISRLHALNELEQLENILHDLALINDESATLRVVDKLKSEWDERLNIVQQSCRTCEPILCLRRAGLHLAKDFFKNKLPSATKLFDSLLGDTWLKSATIAMNSEFYQKAYSYLLKAEEYAPPTLFLEKAKWFWLCEKHEEALITLKRGLAILLPENKVPEIGFSLTKRKICAEAKLLIASYNAAISNVNTDANIMHYKEAIEMLKECEKSLVYLGQYYDRVFQNFLDGDKDSKGSDMQIHMINCFGKSLQYGTTYVYQSMPRLLSIWFDYGTRLLDVSSPTIRDDRKQNLLKMTKLIDSFLERLPSFIFLTAFSQLISRICHPQKEVYKELNLIIAKLILKYPQQTLWMMISVIKSSYTLRSKRCIEILSDSRLKTPTMLKLITDFTQLAEKLIELTNKPVGQNLTKISVNSLLRTLPRLISQEDFSPIMVPIHKFRKLILPNADSHTSSYNPFPNHYVYIVSIKDEITVLPSLQRPRRVTFVGSDGKQYIQMLKPKDDLRKDFRLMEFNDIVNQLLSKEAESRERRLNIRLYSVAPLNEECGMIEWIPNLVGLRPTLMTIYKQKGLAMKYSELKDKSPAQSDPLNKKRDIYLKVLLPRHPPVLGEWFRRTFPDAHGWLTARTAYIRTTAVMSMVGHILGLGDRHGENILLDSTCGDVVHVDFNCLFNKGESFEWPERVPFRLTPNMVAAMGPLGVEGLFRKSCACTLRVLRTHTDTLMSIVTPFVYDPLVSWPKRATAAASTNSEKTNELALEHIRDIQKRLQGKVNIRKSRYYSIPLSVEGQTDNLIAEAVNIDNLCQMYIGWGPYL